MAVKGIIDEVCRWTADADYLRRRRLRARHGGMTDAVCVRDTAHLYSWLVEVFSYQGIADARASAYMDAHGRLAHADVVRALDRDQGAICPKLLSYWHFHRCDYAKGTCICAEPELLAACPLPRHDLRNGRLNQMAYALFLFVRDVCAGDLVGWIDAQLTEAARSTDADRVTGMREALLGPMGEVYGISHKVLAMALAELLLAADPDRAHWVETGASMVAVDTLVHNWLHRTGIIQELGRTHPYGPLCYAAGGCVDVIERCSAKIDARVLCPDGPAYFPRLVQHGIWRFCAAGGLDICNGNRINDRIGCMQLGCPLSERCAHLPPT